MTVVLTILGLISIAGLRQLHRHLDQLAVRNAVAEAATAVARARDEAMARRTIIALRVDAPQATITLVTRGDTIAVLPLGASHGVTLSSSRDSIAFDVRGLGYGAANLTLVARRGAAAETLVVSRLGRARA